MGETIEVNQGEILIKFKNDSNGRITFSDFGLSPEDLEITGGFLRIVFDMEEVISKDYYSVPTIELKFAENIGETHWQCDFNGVTILDKKDHHGNSTILLLNRTKIENLEHHHENKLILHAEFPEPIQLLQESSVFLFKEK